jgi:hypothetical protein
LKETYVLKKVKQNLKEKFQTIWKNKLFNDKRKNIEHKNKLVLIGNSTRGSQEPV